MCRNHQNNRNFNDNNEGQVSKMHQDLINSAFFVSHTQKRFEFTEREKETYLR